MSERSKVLELFENPQSDWREKAEENIRKYRKGTANIKVTDKSGKPIPDAKIEISQVKHAFKFGANCFMLDELESEEKNTCYKEKFARLFNMATLPFYWMDTEPTEGKTRYAIDSPKVYRRPPIDLCMKFCEENGIEPREHALAYERLYPKWLGDLPAQKVKEKMELHFKEIAELYKDKINTIEVTNEMLWSKGTTSFYKEIDYVEWCFKTARKYFKDNQLVINEWTPAAWGDDNYFNYICANLDSGAPIDAIGMQYHIFMPEQDEYNRTRAAYYNPEALQKRMDLYSQFNMPLQVTEVTVPAYSNGEEDELIQAKLIEYLYTLWFSHPNMEQIMYWNLIDGYAYVEDPDEEKIKKSQGDMTLGENVYYGGLLRFDMTEKPAYKTLNELINNRWRTNETVSTDSFGTACFSGFYGDYEIKVSTGSSNYTEKIKLSKNSANEFVIAI